MVARGGAGMEPYLRHRRVLRSCLIGDKIIPYSSLGYKFNPLVSVLLISALSDSKTPVEYKPSSINSDLSLASHGVHHECILAVVSKGPCGRVLCMSQQKSQLCFSLLDLFLA